MKFSSHKWNFITNVKPKPDNIASKIFLNLHSLHFPKKKKRIKFFQTTRICSEKFHSYSKILSRENTLETDQRTAVCVTKIRPSWKEYPALKTMALIVSPKSFYHFKVVSLQIESLVHSPYCKQMQVFSLPLPVMTLHTAYTRLGYWHTFLQA